MIKLVIVMCLIIMFVAIIQVKPGLTTELSYEGRIKPLVDNELAFANHSLEIGLTQGFMDYIAADGILFRPRPVNGPAYLKERPNKIALLTWYATFADLAASGEMGITSGPWEYRQEKMEDAPVAFGHFFTVWMKDADDKWKFAIDTGISHNQPEVKVTEVSYPVESRRTSTTIGKPDSNELTVIDRQFSDLSAEKGYFEAFKQMAASDVRLYRDEHYPFIGFDQAVTGLQTLLKGGKRTWTPEYAYVAKSGDLGYTYGVGKFQSDSETENPSYDFCYVRVWKRLVNEPWKLVLDIENPIPPDKQ